MAKTSIHFEPCNVVKSEIHNSRVQELDYIFPELSKNNESLCYISNLTEREKECKALYEEKVGQKMQSKTVPIREGVVVIDEKTTMKDLELLANEIKHLLGWTPLQIHIHRDEGYMKSSDNKGGSEVAKLNLHAHLIFDCQDKNTGKMCRNTKQQMSQVQDLCANILKMERGQKSNRKHLKSLEYKILVKEQEFKRIEEENKKLQEEIKRLQKKSIEYIQLTTPEDIEDYKTKSLFGMGKKIDEEKIQQLILSEKNKASIIQALTNSNLKLKQESDKILTTYKRELERLQIEQEELEKQKNDLNRLKKDYFNKVQHLAHQQQELSKLSQLKADFEVLNDKYRKLKHLEGIDYSKKFIEESIWVRFDVEKQVSKQIMQELQNETFRSRQELYATFCERMEKSGFLEFVGKELGDKNPLFEIWEEEMNFQYRSRGMRL